MSGWKKKVEMRRGEADLENEPQRLKADANTFFNKSFINWSLEGQWESRSSIRAFTHVTFLNDEEAFGYLKRHTEFLELESKGLNEVESGSSQVCSS